MAPRRPISYSAPMISTEGLSESPARGWAGVREEFGPQLKLAWPLVVSELGWMGMGVVDTLMVGRVSPEAMGGVAVGGNFQMPIVLFGLGVLLGLDPLVSQAVGAGRHRDARHALIQGLYVAAGLSVALVLLLVGLRPFIGRVGLQPAVVPHAVPFFTALIWGVPAFLGFVCLRRYLQGLGHVRPILWALVSANLLNVVVDYTLIFGHFGFPRLGAMGAGYATSFARTYLFLFLLVAILRVERRAGRHGNAEERRFDPALVRRIILVGLPAAAMVVFEVGVFAVATQLIGRIDAVSLAAHQVALTLASVTFMVPLGISAAGGVRVGQAVGRGDAQGVANAGWTAFLLGAGFMCLSGTLFAVAGRWLTGLFSPDPAVIVMGATLLQVAAMFQLFDGTQVVACGVLRGLGETRLPMFITLVGYWGLGLPIGWFLAFHAGLGARGLWLGLMSGLIAVGLLLLATWIRKARGFRDART